MGRIGTRLSAEDEQRVADMLRVGGVPSRIAALVGCRPSTVRTVAAQHGLMAEFTAHRRSQRRTPPEVEQRVIAMLRDGVIHRVIAAECDVSRSVVHRIAQEHGIRHQWEPERIEAIAHLLRSGLRNNEVVRSLGVPYWQVSQVRRRIGLPMRPLRPVTTGELEQARRLLEDGASYGEVERTLGRAPNTFRRLLPGYAWNREQIAEWQRTMRMRPEDHSRDVFELAFSPRGGARLSRSAG